MQTLYFENSGDGSFVSHTLPKEVNYSTMFSILPIKNESKPEKVLLAGNYKSVNTWQTPYDASYGVVISPSGQNQFSNIQNSGFYVEGEVRAMKNIVINNMHYVMVAINNAPLQFFKIKD